MYTLLKSKLPHKNVRRGTMIREPLAMIASNWNEWYCRNMKWVGKANKWKLPTVENTTNYLGCHGYTLKELNQVRITSNRLECGNKTERDLKKLDPHRRRTCKHILENGGWDDMPECASVSAFLESKSYHKIFHNHGPYARCTLPPTHLNSTVSHSQKIVQAALKYIGGIDVAYGDMIWVGVTERMHESMCLLHYKLRLPWITTPRERVKNCRPQTYWSEPDKQVFYKKEPMMRRPSSSQRRPGHPTSQNEI